MKPTYSENNVNGLISEGSDVYLYRNIESDCFSWTDHDYNMLQKAIGIRTNVAKLAYPWQKGAIERPIRQ